MVFAVVTTNQTGPNSGAVFPPTGPQQGGLGLTYTPSGFYTVLGAHGVPVGMIPYGASFATGPGSPQQLIIQASPYAGGGYSITWQGTPLASVNVDSATNIVYGPVGNAFVTISLCGLFTGRKGGVD